MSALLRDRRTADPAVLVDRDDHNYDMSERRRVDRVAAEGAALALVMTVFYIWLMSQPGYRPLTWDFFARRLKAYQTLSTDQGIHPWLLILAVLLTATALAGYGARITWPYRRTALLLAGVVLTPIGIRAFLTIRLIEAPIFLAGLLCLVAAARRRHEAIGS